MTRNSSGGWPGDALTDSRAVALTSGFRGRQVILVPHTATRDWRLFTAAWDRAVRSPDEKCGSTLELTATVQEQADKWPLVATMRAPHGPEGPIEFDVV